jgi:excisionase family DNA binding protein
VTPALDELLTIDEAAAALRMSRTTFRRRLDRGEFTVIRDRRLVLVPRAALEAYVSRHTTHSQHQSSPQRPPRSSPDASGASRPVSARRRRLWDADEGG